MKRYQNELVVFLTFLLMFTAFLYKNGQRSSQVKEVANTKQALNDFREIVVLRKIWAGKKTSNKVEKLKALIPASKVTWSKKSKKVTAVYKGLSSNELNKVMT